MQSSRKNPGRSTRYQGNYCQTREYRRRANTARAAAARTAATTAARATTTTTTTTVAATTIPMTTGQVVFPPSPPSATDNSHLRNCRTYQVRKGTKRPAEAGPEHSAKHQCQDLDEATPSASPTGFNTPSSSPRPGPSRVQESPVLGSRLLEPPYSFSDIYGGNSETPSWSSEDEEEPQASPSPSPPPSPQPGPSRGVRGVGQRNNPYARPDPDPFNRSPLRHIVAEIAAIGAAPPEWIVEPAYPIRRPPPPFPFARPQVPPPAPTSAPVRRYPQRRRLPPQQHWRNNRPRYSWDGTLLGIDTGHPEDTSSARSIMTRRDRYERERRRR